MVMDASVCCGVCLFGHVFVKYLFKEKKDGLFLDIACDDPIHGSNTYVLEKEYNWNGFCIISINSCT